MEELSNTAQTNLNVIKGFLQYLTGNNESELNNANLSTNAAELYQAANEYIRKNASPGENHKFKNEQPELTAEPVGDSTEYRIFISETPCHLSHLVMSRMNSNWKLYGPPIIYHDNEKLMFSQPMIR